MAPRPTPIAYATAAPETPLAADLPRATWRTAAAAAWLAVIVAALIVSAAWMNDEQWALDQAMLALNVRRPFLSASGSLFLVLSCGGAVAFPVLFGAVAAIALYHWRRGQLAWVVTVPAAVGAWVLLTALCGSEAGQGWLPALGASSLQCGLTYAGTTFGRPTARWVVRRLLPPPLAVELISLWI